MKIGVELEFFICHKSDETFYMPDIISRYLKYNSGFISMQKDSKLYPFRVRERGTLSLFPL